MTKSKASRTAGKKTTKGNTTSKPGRDYVKCMNKSTGRERIYIYLAISDSKPTEMYIRRERNRDITEALARVISTALKHGAPSKEILKQIKATNASYGGSNQLLDSIADALKSAPAKTATKRTVTKNKATARKTRSCK